MNASTAIWMIRPAHTGDAAAIAQVSVDTWRSTYRGLMPDTLLDGLSYEQSTQEWVSRLTLVSNTSTWVFVAVTAAGEIVGFASGGPAEHASFGYNGQIFTLYVRDADQGGGIGRALVAAGAAELAARGMTSVQIWALADGPANAFYARLGGTPLGPLPFKLYGYTLIESGYGWNDTSVLIAQCRA